MNEFHDDLYELAEFFRKHPLIIEPYISGRDVTYHVWRTGEEETIAELVHEVSKKIGGTWAKNDPNRSDYDRTYYVLARKDRVAGFKVSISALREAVCERIEVGIKQVIIPAQKAREEEVIEETIYEWQCIPLNKHADELA